MKKRLINLIISIIIGLAVFIFFIYRTGPGAIKLLTENMNWIYFALFLITSTLAHSLAVLRWSSIIKAYKKNIPFFRLFKQAMAGYAVSYVTPSARVGGEPVRAYMLKKESGMDLKTGTASIIIDRFVEFTGAIAFAILGIILLIYFPGIPISVKIILTIIISLGLTILSVFYYRTVTKAHSISSLLDFFNIHKIGTLKKFIKILKEIELKMKYFFIKNKKQFIISNLIEAGYLIIIIIESKLILLTFGVNLPIAVIILALNIHGLVTFIPVPAGLGFLEAGEAGFFKIIGSTGTIGITYTLLMRLRDILFVSIGFASISHFSGKQISNIIKTRSIKNNKKEI